MGSFTSTPDPTPEPPKRVFTPENYQENKKHYEELAKEYDDIIDKDPNYKGPDRYYLIDQPKFVDLNQLNRSPNKIRYIDKDLLDRNGISEENLNKFAPSIKICYDYEKISNEIDIAYNHKNLYIYGIPKTGDIFLSNHDDIQKFVEKCRENKEVYDAHCNKTPSSDTPSSGDEKPSSGGKRKRKTFRNSKKDSRNRSRNRRRS